MSHRIFSTEGPDIDEVPSDFDIPAPDFDGGAADFEKGAPAIGLTAPDFDRGVPDLHRGPSEIDGGAPDIDITAPDIDAGTPEIDISHRAGGAAHRICIFRGGFAYSRREIRVLAQKLDISAIRERILHTAAGVRTLFHWHNRPERSA